MEKLKMDELLWKTIKELVQMRKEAKSELHELRMKNSMRALEETHLISEAKKYVARLNTAIKQKQKDLDSNSNK